MVVVAVMAKMAPEPAMLMSTLVMRMVWRGVHGWTGGSGGVCLGGQGGDGQSGTRGKQEDLEGFAQHESFPFSLRAGCPAAINGPSGAPVFCGLCFV